MRMTLTTVVQRVRGVDAETLSAWVAQEWVRPRREGGAPVFEEVDVARVRLIAELRELEVGEGAMPVVLSLLDQLHATRGRMLAVLEALHGAGPEDRVAEVLTRLGERSLRQAPASRLS